MKSTDAVIGALAAHRLTRLATQDVISSRLRKKILDRFPPTEDSLSYNLVCSWCAGVWAGALVAGAQSLPGRPGRVAQAALYALALADVVGLAEDRL